MGITAAELNKRNREFWQKRKVIMARQLADDAIVSIAVADLKSEELRRVPVYNRKTFEKALDDAEAAKSLFQSRVASPSAWTHRERQKYRARMKRPKTLGAGIERDAIIRGLVCKPEHHDLSVKELWDLFVNKLKELGVFLEIIETKVKHLPWTCIYRNGNTMSRISAKRFANIVSAVRRRQKSH